jgi:hypothetical protein
MNVISLAAFLFFMRCVIAAFTCFIVTNLFRGLGHESNYWFNAITSLLSILALTCYYEAEAKLSK